MKRWMVLLIALIAALVLSCGALAETPAQEENGSPFLTWLNEGWDMLTDAVEDGWDTVSDAVSTGADAVRQALAGWKEKVENYLAELNWGEEIQSAWETLKQGAENTGTVVAEDMAEAYRTVRDWLKEKGGTVDQSIEEALDQVASAAGVAEAAFSGWSRRVEQLFAEHSDTVTEAVSQAWQTVREAAADAGSVTRENLKTALATIRDWLGTLDAQEAEEAGEALDGIAESLEMKE